MTKKVNASPAKRFFVEMLTRDIELSDAILDLLDNCVDGAIRSGPIEGSPKGKPYKGYYAKINLSPRLFSIEDNCGGISHDIAVKYALRLGRDDPNRDADKPTVGVYGIGMKRAIFKLGTNAEIHSDHPDGPFSIPITSKWMEDDDDWELEMYDAKPLDEYGTKITVKKLKSNISTLFDSKINDFESDFREILRKHYSYIIEKGLTVEVNKVPIVPKLQKLLYDKNFNAGTIAPYIYQLDHDGVRVELIMGLYEKLPSDMDIEDGVSGRRSKTEAGWTVICNDRIVIDNDKTHLTGWGENGVPHYHSQFVAIAGVVTFTSNDAKKLPVKTTKRGIDQDSALYSVVKNEMREALRTFTGFTNHWKTDTPERQSIQSSTQSMDVRSIAAILPPEKWKKVIKGGEGRRFVPELPKNETENSNARIVFVRPLKDVATVREYFGEGVAVRASEIGGMAFDEVLERAQES